VPLALKGHDRVRPQNLEVEIDTVERQIATNECEFNTSEAVLRTLPATEPLGDWPRGRGLLGLLIFCNLSVGIPILRQLCEQHGNLMRQCSGPRWRA
jgi:hypothetical protein